MRRIRPSFERLEARLALAGLLNGDFSISDPTNPGYGWTTRGSATIANGEGILNEGTAVQSELSQTFTIAPGTTALRFTITGSDLVSNGQNNPPDAFEAALLNATTMDPLVGPPTGLSNTDSFLNIQQSGNVYYAPQVTVPGADASGSVASLSFPEVITVDVSSVPANTQATLFFDLIGFNPATSSVRVDDVAAIQGPALPALSFVLDPSTDSGTVGDSLTRFNPVNLLGATDPNLTVKLDSHGGSSFNDGTTTADANGHFHFNGITLAQGTNTVNVEATNAQGTTVATRTISVDTQPPTGILQTPAPGSIITANPGHVDVQWTDPGLAGIDTTTYSTSNITVTGVTINSFQDLGSGLVQYNYSGTLPTGTINVTEVAGQVADKAANANAQATQSFTFQTQITQPPVAVNDSYSVTENTTLNVPATGVLANDTSADGKALAAALDVGPSHGTLNLNADGSFSYVPTAGYSGTDSFTYRAAEGSLLSNVATVALTINAVVTTQPPVAANDSYSVTENATLNVPAAGVLANDTSSDGKALTASLVANPSHGTLHLNADGSFSYIPTAGYSGADSFTYRAAEGSLLSNVATVALSVTAVVTTQPPVATNDSYSLTENTTLSVPAAGVLTNDTSADGKALTASLAANPSHGTLQLNADGSFSYVPTAGYSGTDSFTYRATEGSLLSNVATVTLTINAVVTTQPPVADDDNYTLTQDTTLSVPAAGVLANDSSPDGKALTATLAGSPLHGTLQLNADGSFSYTPDAGYVGIDSFTYRAMEGSLVSNVATVALTVNAATVSVPVITGSFLTLPGTPDQIIRLRFDWTFRSARYNDELGVFQVDDATGSVDGQVPGSAGYLKAALSSPSRQVVFYSGEKAGVIREFDFPGGSRIELYMVANGTTKSALSGRHPVYFTAAAANHDLVNHVRIKDAGDGTTRYSWEDERGGGDRDFNDVVMNVSMVSLTPANPGVGAIQVPGSTGTSVSTRFSLLQTSAGYHNEVGLYRVDDASGRIGALLPGDPGYMAAALAVDRHQTLFKQGMEAPHTLTLSLNAGTYYGLYLIADGSVADQLAGRARGAFFSFDGANPDGLGHVRRKGTSTFAFEDTLGGGDMDFNDAVLNVHYLTGS